MFFPVPSDGGGRADGCTCVATFVCWADGCPGPNTKGLPMLSPRAPGSGQIGGGRPCLHLSRRTCGGRGGTSCCGGPWGGGMSRKKTKGFLIFTPVTSSGYGIADGCTCVATFVCWANDYPKQTTKGFSMLSSLVAVGGLFGGTSLVRLRLEMLVSTAAALAAERA